MSTMPAEAECRLGNVREDLPTGLAETALPVLVTIWGLVDFVALIRNGQPIGARAIALLMIGAGLLLATMLRSNVLWTIEEDGIRIDRRRRFGRTRTENIRASEIADLRLVNNRDDNAASFSLAVRLASGDLLISPPISDVTRVHEISIAIARRWGFCDTAHGPAAAASTTSQATRTPRRTDSVDAANPEIYLGSRSTPARGKVTRAITMMMAGLFSVPFLWEIWRGETLSRSEILAISIGLIAIIAILRYPYLFSNPFWIIREGEIHVERVSLTGKPQVESIVSNDVAKIAFVKHVAEETFFTIDVRLNSGRILSSAPINDEVQAQKLKTAIARRLNAPVE